jgi:hypothetical protein
MSGTWNTEGKNVNKYIKIKKNIFTPMYFTLQLMADTLWLILALKTRNMNQMG